MCLRDMRGCHHGDVRGEGGMSAWTLTLGFLVVIALCIALFIALFIDYLDTYTSGRDIFDRRKK